jgi:hypothetical protein
VVNGCQCGERASFAAAADAFNGNLIVFSYAGDLWSVDRKVCSRPTTGTGVETDRYFRRMER